MSALYVVGIPFVALGLLSAIIMRVGEHLAKKGLIQI